MNRYFKSISVQNPVKKIPQKCTNGTEIVDRLSHKSSYELCCGLFGKSVARQRTNWGARFTQRWGLRNRCYEWRQREKKQKCFRLSNSCVIDNLLLLPVPGYQPIPSLCLKLSNRAARLEHNGTRKLHACPCMNSLPRIYGVSLHVLRHRYR